MLVEIVYLLFTKSPTNLFTVTPPGDMLVEPSLILVWLSNMGSSTLTAMAATNQVSVEDPGSYYEIP